MVGGGGGGGGEGGGSRGGGGGGGQSQQGGVKQAEAGQVVHLSMSEISLQHHTRQLLGGKGSSLPHAGADTGVLGSARPAGLLRHRGP